MRHKMQQYGIVFMSSAVADFIYTFYVYALSHDWLILALLSGSVIPFINFVGAILFVDAKTTRERLFITTMTALGMLVGGFITMVVIGKPTSVK